MAPAKKEATAEAVVVNPPAVRRRTKHYVPDSILESLIEQLEAGNFASISDPTTESGLREFPIGEGEKAVARVRGAASSAALRLKQLIVASPLSPYEDVKDMTSRVWEVREGFYTFAIKEKDRDNEAASDDDE